MDGRSRAGDGLEMQPALRPAASAAPAPSLGRAGHPIAGRIASESRFDFDSDAPGLQLEVAS